MKLCICPQQWTPCRNGIRSYLHVFITFTKIKWKNTHKKTAKICLTLHWIPYILWYIRSTGVDRSIFMRFFLAEKWPQGSVKCLVPALLFFFFIKRLCLYDNTWLLLYDEQNHTVAVSKKRPHKKGGVLRKKTLGAELLLEAATYALSSLRII